MANIRFILVLLIRDTHDKQNAKLLGTFSNQLDQNKLEILEVIEVSNGKE